MIEIRATLGPLEARLDPVGRPGEPGPLRVEVGSIDLLLNERGEQIEQSKVAV